MCLNSPGVVFFFLWPPDCRPPANLQVAVVVRIIKSHQGETIAAKRSSSGTDLRTQKLCFARQSITIELVVPLQKEGSALRGQSGGVCKQRRNGKTNNQTN